MSRGIKLVLMGVAGAALLYSCSPGIGAGLGRAALPVVPQQSLLPAAGRHALPARRAQLRAAGQSIQRQRKQRIGAQPQRLDDDGHQQGRAELQPARRLRRNGVVGRLIGHKLMRREASTPRPGWQQKLEQLGFDYYMLEGKAYWTEQACYAFTSDEIDQLEAATETLHGLCLKAVEHVVANKLWERMRIPPAWGDYIEQVWRRADPTICRPLRPRLRRQGPAQAAGIQRRHADRALRGGGRAMVLAEGHEARRRPVQFDPRETDRGLARRPGQAAAGGAWSTSRASRTIPRISRRRNTCATPRCRRASPASRSPCRRSAGTAGASPITDEMPIQVMSQALSLGMDGARGIRRPRADRHHGLHRARLEDDPVQQDAVAAPVGRLSRPREPAAGLRHASTPTSAAPT